MHRFFSLGVARLAASVAVFHAAAAAAGAAAVEIAARVIDALECLPFGRRRAAAGGRVSTIPMFPHRKTG